jgi:hypothetical protein
MRRLKRARKLPGALRGGAPIWGPVFSSLRQSTAHALGIEVIGINWRAGLLPQDIQTSGIEAIEAQFIAG